MIPSLMLANRGISWVHSNLHYFSPFRSTNQFDEQRVKPLCELALLCWLMLRNQHFINDSRIWSCLHLICETYNNGSFFERLFRVPEAFVPYVLIAVTLNKVGLLSGEDLHVFQILIDRSNALLSERPPHRQLELRHILDVGSFTHRLPSYRALYMAGIASKPVNPIYVTDYDAYSLTHTLLYCSDFGARGVAGPSPRHLRRAYRSVKALLGMYTVRANWDIVAELLVCCHCLKKTSSMLYASAWKELVEAQWESGVVPGPFYHPDEEKGLQHHEKQDHEKQDHEKQDHEKQDHEKQDYVFRECYHTTLVSCLAGALCPWQG